MRLGKFIREERRRVGLKQAQLAIILNCGADVISKYERDVIQPSTRRLKQLAGVFGRTMDAMYEADAGEDATKSSAA